MLPGYSYAGKHVQPGGMLIGSSLLLPSFLFLFEFYIDGTSALFGKKQWIMIMNQFLVSKVCQNTYKLHYFHSCVNEEGNFCIITVYLCK